MILLFIALLVLIEVVASFISLVVLRQGDADDRRRGIAKAIWMVGFVGLCLAWGIYLEGLLMRSASGPERAGYVFLTGIVFAVHALGCFVYAFSVRLHETSRAQQLVWTTSVCLPFVALFVTYDMLKP